MTWSMRQKEKQRGNSDAKSEAMLFSISTEPKANVSAFKAGTPADKKETNIHCQFDIKQSKNH